MAACSICNDPVLIAALKVALGSSPGPSGAIETINGVDPDANGNFVLDPGAGVSIIQTAINQLTVSSTVPITSLVYGIATLQVPVNNSSLDVTAYTSPALTIPSLFNTKLKISFSCFATMASAPITPVNVQFFATAPAGAPVQFHGYYCYLNNTSVTQISSYYYGLSSLFTDGSVITVHVAHPTINVELATDAELMFEVVAFTP